MITKLKCEGCGASDFKKHPIIDEFLVCTCCGNQYMKQIREIADNLPIDLKVTIKGDHSKLIINNAIIKGDFNTIVGNFNIVVGDHNTSKGENNILKGDFNTNR